MPSIGQQNLRDGRIVRIDDFRGQREALIAAGVAEDVDWR